MSDSLGLVGELLQLQQAYNEWWETATPEARAASARASLRYIAETDDDAPDWYADA